MKKWILFITFFSISSCLFSNTEKQTKPKDDSKLQDKVINTWHNVKSTMSNIQFYNSNYGIFGYDKISGAGGTFWPRGSKYQYIFGAGIWFGAKKINPNTNSETKYCFYTYDPNNGSGMATPGSIDDGDTLRNDLTNKYRVYQYTDGYNTIGEPINFNSGPNWPLWSSNYTTKMEFGINSYEYVSDTNKRKGAIYPLGISMYSDEDMFCIYKDTYLEQYNGGAAKAQTYGYPLRIEIKQRVLSWGSGSIDKDVMVIIYEIENKSSDTLKECYLGSVIDPDLAILPYATGINDFFRYVKELPYLNMGIVWTDFSQGEDTEMGYLGISLLETPVVDNNNYLVNNSELLNPNIQIGMNGIQELLLDEDPKTDRDKYNKLSSKIKNTNTSGPDDIRALLSTGSFTMLPKQKARLAVGLAFALPGKGNYADGTLEDINRAPVNGGYSLVKKMDYLRNKYYKNFTLDVDNKSNSNIVSINQVYPNPVINSISINYNTEVEGTTNISLYNELGESIKTLYNEYEASGNHNHTYNLEELNLNNGVYYIRIQSADKFLVKGINILK